VQGVPDKNGVPQKTSIRSIDLGGAYGGNAKLSIAKQVITALNKVYGGDAFPAPSSAVLQGTQITVPDLSGKSVSDAQSIITGLGLQYADGGQVDSTLPAGQVAATNPPAGTTVGLGGTVTVATSNGSLIAVPTVAGMSAADATNALSQAGFTVSYSGSPKASVTGTDPPAGTGLHKGDTVTLTVADAPTGGGHTSTPAPGPTSGPQGGGQ
jgi:beta-lactam-binding protein with PASTA domain